MFCLLELYTPAHSATVKPGHLTSFPSDLHGLGMRLSGDYVGTKQPSSITVSTALAVMEAWERG